VALWRQAIDFKWRIILSPLPSVNAKMAH